LSTAQGSGSSLKNYGLNQLKKVLRRPSEPAEEIGKVGFASKLKRARVVRPN